MQRNRKTYPIREVLESYLAKNKHIRYRIKAAEAPGVWARICGDWVSLHSEAVQMKDETLLVKTDSPSLANELSLKERELREGMNKELACPLIKKIVFKSGYIKKSNTRDEKDSIKAEEKQKLTMETVRKVDRLVEPVRGAELRETLRKLLLSSAKRKKEN